MHASASLRALAALCFILLSASVTSAAYIQVAGMIANSTLGSPPGTNYDSAKSEAPALLRGWKLWVQEVNARGIDIAGTLYYVNLTIVDCGGSYDTVYNTTEAIARGDFGPIDFILGPWGSDYSLAAALAAEAHDVVLITNVASAQSVFVCPSGGIPGCPEANARRVTKSFGAVPTAETFYGAAINLLVIQGAKTIAIYNEAGLFQNSSRVSALSAANEYGLSILMDKTIPVNPDQATVESITAELATLNADIVFGSQFLAGTIAVIKEMKRIDYTPGALIMRLNYGHLREVLGDDARYLLDTLFFDERLRGEDYIDDLYFVRPGNSSDAVYLASDPSPLRFAKAIRHTFGANTILATDPVAFLQGAIIERGLLRAKSIAPSDVRAVIPELVFRSFMGRVSFNAFGYNDKTPPVTIQRDENWDLQVVSPIGTATRNIIYPMPLWEEREAEYAYYATPAEIAILVITVVCVVISVAFGIFIIATWSNKVVRAGSPPFMLLVVAGSVLIYIGVLTWPLHTDTSMCLATPWMLVGGFVLLFSALFSRTYRLMKIFKDDNLNKTFRISDAQLYIIVVVLELIAVIILVLWTTVGPQEAILNVPDSSRPSLNFYSCQTGRAGTIFLAIAGTYIFFIIVVGVIMSLRIWNIPFEIYSESKYIGFAMYNLLFFFIVAIVTSLVFSSDQRIVSYVLRSLCIILGNLITMCSLFIPKMHLVQRGVDSKKSWGDKISSDSSSSLSTNRAGSASSWMKATLPVHNENILEGGASAVRNRQLVEELANIKKELRKTKKMNKQLVSRLKKYEKGETPEVEESEEEEDSEEDTNSTSDEESSASSSSLSSTSN